MFCFLIMVCLKREAQTECSIRTHTASSLHETVPLLKHDVAYMHDEMKVLLYDSKPCSMLDMVSCNEHHVLSYIRLLFTVMKL